MARRFWRKQPERTVYVGSHEDKLARLAPLRADPDERPTREDRERRGSPFEIPVPVPRVLRGRGRRRRKRSR